MIQASRSFNRLAATILLVVATVPILFLYVWLALRSFSSTLVYGVIPTGLTLHNWRFLWENVTPVGSGMPGFWSITANTLALAVGLAILEIAICTLSGYTLSRLTFRGRDLIMQGTMFLHALPGVALLIALYYVLKMLGLLDTLLGVLLVKLALDVPMNTWIIKGFFDDVPWDIEWSALVDGCSRFTAWRRVVLPMVAPGLASVAIFAFISGWSEFLYVFTFIFSKAQFTLAIFLKSVMADPQNLDYGLVTAVGTFYLLPVLVFFILTQKSLMKVSVGGSKG